MFKSGLTNKHTIVIEKRMKYYKTIQQNTQHCEETNKKKIKKGF